CSAKCSASLSSNAASERSRQWCVQEAAGNRSVAVNAAVAQKWPVAADVFQLAQIHFAQQNFFFIFRSFGDHRSERIAQKRLTPELQTFTCCSRRRCDFAQYISVLVAHTVHHRNVNSVRDGVRALYGPPGVVLRNSVFFLF